MVNKHQIARGMIQMGDLLALLPPPSPSVLAREPITKFGITKFIALIAFRFQFPLYMLFHIF